MYLDDPELLRRHRSKDCVHRVLAHSLLFRHWSTLSALLLQPLAWSSLAERSYTMSDNFTVRQAGFGVSLDSRAVAATRRGVLSLCRERDP